MEINFNNIDLYEVDEYYYNNYVYRTRNRQTIKKTPEEGLTVWEDIETKLLLYGYKEEIIMGMPARNYYIFNILADSELSEPLYERRVQLSDDQWDKVLKLLGVKLND